MVGGLVLTFIGLVIVPLYLMFWFKKRNQPPPIVRLLNQCIHHGQTLSSEECTKINGYIKETKCSLEAFAEGKHPSSRVRVSLAQAMEVLPLIYEISQPNTCCERLLLDELNYHAAFDCKLSLRALFKELEAIPDLPIISDELHQIRRVKRKMRAGKRRRNRLIFLVILVYCCTSFLLAQSILFTRTSWRIELGIYLGCLLVFFLTYDYYYSKEFGRYQKRLKLKVNKA